MKTNKFQGHISHTRYPGCGKQEIDQLPPILDLSRVSHTRAGGIYLATNSRASKQVVLQYSAVSLLEKKEKQMRIG